MDFTESESWCLNAVKASLRSEEPASGVSCRLKVGDDRRVYAEIPVSFIDVPGGGFLKWGAY